MFRKMHNGLISHFEMRAIMSKREIGHESKGKKCVRNVRYRKRPNNVNKLTHDEKLIGNQLRHDSSRARAQKEEEIVSLAVSRC